MERCRWEGQNFPPLKEVQRLDEKEEEEEAEEEKEEEVYWKNYIGLHKNYPLYLLDFN